MQGTGSLLDERTVVAFVAVVFIVYRDCFVTRYRAARWRLQIANVSRRKSQMSSRLTLRYHRYRGFGFCLRDGVNVLGATVNGLKKKVTAKSTESMRSLEHGTGILGDFVWILRCVTRQWGWLFTEFREI